MAHVGTFIILMLPILLKKYANCYVLVLTQLGFQYNRPGFIKFDFMFAIPVLSSITTFYYYPVSSYYDFLSLLFVITSLPPVLHSY